MVGFMMSQIGPILPTGSSSDAIGPIGDTIISTVAATVIEEITN